MLETLFGPRGSRQFIIVSGVVIVLIPLVIVAIVQALAGPDPSVGVRAVTDQDDIVIDGESVGAAYVIPQPRAALTAPPPGAESSCSGRFDWATEQGGVVADNANLRVTLSPRESESLVIDDVDVVVVRSDEPAAGTLASCAGRGGGSDPLDTSVLSIGFAGRSAPSVRFASGDGEPADFALAMSGSQTATFDVFATTADCDCAFYLRLGGTQNGEPVNFDVRGPGGSPFRVTSTERSDVAAYDEATGGWELQPETGPGRPTVDPNLDPTDPLLAGIGPSACARLDAARLGQLAGVRLRADAGSDRFALNPGLSGGTMAVAICSWNAGPPGAGGVSPTLGLQHLVLEDAAAANDAIRVLLDGMATNGGAFQSERITGRSVEVQVGAESPSAVWREGRSVYVVTGAGGLDAGFVRQTVTVLSDDLRAS